jgi:hypothetical protein
MIIFQFDSHTLVPATQLLLEPGAGSLQAETAPQPPDMNGFMLTCKTRFLGRSHGLFPQAGYVYNGLGNRDNQS